MKTTIAQYHVIELDFNAVRCIVELYKTSMTYDLQRFMLVEEANVQQSRKKSKSVVSGLFAIICANHKV